MEKIKIINPNSIGFLPNGDLVIVSVVSVVSLSLWELMGGCKVYSYSVDNKPTTNTTLWKCSQIYDIEFTESLKEDYPDCIMYQTKLFFLNKRSMIQWNLLTMTFDIQYFFDDDLYRDKINIVINKNQTLLALNNHGKIDVFSMETGMHISRYS